MLIVALAWMYVVLMMAVAEALSSQGSLLGAFFTLLLYGLLPLGIVLYIGGTPGRKKLRQRQEAAALSEAALAPQSASTQPSATDTSSTEPGPAQPNSTQPDRSGQAAGAPVAAERKEL